MKKNGLKVLILLLLIVGIFFRFANLDRKVYWPDETFTSLRISGYTRSELIRQVFNGHEIGVEDLQKYQGINPEKSLSDTIKGLAVEEPQLPPLYFVLARFWAQCFGNSVAAIRSLSALISLLVFPCIYWLCRELFELPFLSHTPVTGVKRGVGWVAIALIAVSPFHLLYAQEARPYSLWMVTTLVSSAAFLRAIRLRTKLSWGLYAIAVALGLYTFLFSAFVVIGHGIYVFAIERFRFSKTITAFLLASLLGFVAFIPWLFAVIINFSKAQKGTDWASAKVSLLSLVAMWAGNISRLFIDFGFGSDDRLRNLIPLVPLILIILLMVVYSIYFLCRQTPKQIWLFILTLIGVSALALMLPDLIFGGRRSGVARYLIPSYLGIQIAVAYLLANKITTIFVKIWRQKFWQFVTVVLFSCGILSCIISYQAEIWWNKRPDLTKYNPQVAHIINQAHHPLLISDDEPESLLSLSYLLAPKVRLQLVARPKILNNSQGFSDRFLYKPSKKFLYILRKQNYKIKEIKELGNFKDKLWQLEKTS